MFRRRKDDAARPESRAYIPGWVEPPGSRGYLAAQRRQLRDFIFWVVLALALMFALTWPFLYYALVKLRVAEMAPHWH